MNKIFETRNDLINSFDKDLIIAELGVFRGDFSKEILNITKPKQLFLVDLFTGFFGSGDKDGKNHINLQLEEEYENLKSFFSENKNVNIIKSDTTSFLKSLPFDYLDVVYIDADHSYKSVKEDLDNSLPKVKTGGFICGHDLVKNSDVEKAVIEFCLENALKIESVTNDGCPSFLIIKK